MERARNQTLILWMDKHRVDVPELTRLVNKAIAALTGKTGTITELTVRRWRSGEVTWPKEPQRTALEQVTGLPATQLGFTPRRKGTSASKSPEEDPVFRRTFLAATTAAGVSLTTSAAANRRHRLSSSDVDRMKAKLAGWTKVEDQRGGTLKLEEHAAGLARETLDLMESGTASSRIRSELYTVAAAFSNSAMWAAIDGDRPRTAMQHLHQTVTLAGLSGDPATEFRVWGHASILYKQQGRHADALAAAERSRSVVARRDPLYVSLALARIGIRHAELGDSRNARLYLDNAQKALDRADMSVHRPAWIDFYDQAELDHLAMIAHLRMGNHSEAESHAHRGLSNLRPGFERNRALIHANLAIAQLGQKDLELAVSTARSIPAEMANHGRVHKILGDFTTQITTFAPRNRETRDWQTYYKAVAA